MNTLLELNKKKIEIQKEHLEKGKEYEAHCKECCLYLLGNLKYILETKNQKQYKTMI